MRRIEVTMEVPIQILSGKVIYIIGKIIQIVLKIDNLKKNHINFFENR